MTSNSFPRDHAGKPGEEERFLHVNASVSGTCLQPTEKCLKRQRRAAKNADIRNYFIEKLKKQESPAKDEETTRFDELKRAQREGAETLRKAQEAEERKVREEHEAALKTYHASLEPGRPATLKAKWKTVTGNKFNYSSDDLHRILSKYGEILTLLMGKKGRTAIVEFARAAAELQAETEAGDPRAPIQLTWKTARTRVYSQL